MMMIIRNCKRRSGAVYVVNILTKHIVHRFACSNI
jgi:hypothetical protein